jgi:phosphatidylglycerophosphate synthase
MGLMADAVPHTPVSTGETQGLERWLTRHSAVMLVAAAVALATQHGAAVTIAAAASFSALWARSGTLALPRHTLANGLTAVRLIVLLVATAALPGLPTGWVLAAFALNVALDSIDGRAARARGEATALGAVLDRETDALFVLVAYLYFHVAGGMSAWVVLAGVLPYLYRLLAANVINVAPDRKERFAAGLAGINFVLLLAAVALPTHSARIVAVSVALVVASFGASFWSLYRHAHPLR